MYVCIYIYININSFRFSSMKCHLKRHNYEHEQCLGTSPFSYTVTINIFGLLCNLLSLLILL